MKAEIINKVMFIKAESEDETIILKEWRELWHKEPKAEKWFEVRYYNPIQTIVI